MNASLPVVHPTRISSSLVCCCFYYCYYQLHGCYYFYCFLIYCWSFLIPSALSLKISHTQSAPSRGITSQTWVMQLSRLKSLSLLVTVTFSHNFPKSPSTLTPLTKRIPLLIEVVVIHLTVSVAIYAMKRTTSREWLANYVPTCTIIIFDLLSVEHSSTCGVVSPVFLFLTGLDLGPFELVGTSRN